MNQSMEQLSQRKIRINGEEFVRSTMEVREAIELLKIVQDGKILNCGIIVEDWNNSQVVMNGKNILFRDRSYLNELYSSNDDKAKKMGLSIDRKEMKNYLKETRKLI